MNRSTKAILFVALASVVLLVVWLGCGVAPQPDSATTKDQHTDADEPAAHLTAGDDSRPASKDVSAGRPLRDDGEHILIPSEWALVPGDSVPAASNWEELVAGLSPEERELAEAFAARYPEAYDFIKPEQLRWMIENGYPSPREMIEAQLMPRGDLIALATSGNAKAQMLVIDLESDELVRGFDALSDREKAQRMMPLLSMQDELMTSCSPFAGYIAMSYGRFQQLLYPDSPPLEVVTQLNYVAALGDWRAEDAMRTAIAELGLPMLETSVLMSSSNLSFGPIVRRQCGTHLLPH